jgi:DNA repair protein RadC
MSSSCSELSQSLNPIETKLVAQALRCLEKRLRYPLGILHNPQQVCSYLRLHLAEERNEVFAILFLDNCNRLLAFEKLFFGTINETIIYPRVVVQKALEHNAAKVIFAHNHPSDDCDPSQADKEITRDLQRVLSAISITAVDHIVVSRKSTYSFAAHGLM